MLAEGHISQSKITIDTLQQLFHKPCYTMSLPSHSKDPTTQLCRRKQHRITKPNSRDPKLFKPQFQIVKQPKLIKNSNFPDSKSKLGLQNPNFGDQKLIKNPNFRFEIQSQVHKITDTKFQRSNLEENSKITNNFLINIVEKKEDWLTMNPR